MSKFCALKSAGMGNRLKIYVSYLARYDEVMVEKMKTDIYFQILNLVIEKKT